MDISKEVIELMQKAVMEPDDTIKLVALTSILKETKEYTSMGFNTGQRLGITIEKSLVSIEQLMTSCPSDELRDRLKSYIIERLFPANGDTNG